MAKVLLFAFGNVAVLYLATEFRVQAYTRTPGQSPERVDALSNKHALENILLSASPTARTPSSFRQPSKAFQHRGGRPIMINRGSEYAESSRPYRRTVYMHKEWRKHRSSQRYLKNLRTIRESGVQVALFSELTVITLAAVCVVVLNLMVSYMDLNGMPHPGLLASLLIGFAPKGFWIPAMPISIFMSALSLLLVFRTNTAYSRWNEARTLWGGIVNNCRNVVRQANIFFPDDPESVGLKEELAANTAGFCKALRNFLRGPDDDEVFRAELMEMANAGLMSTRQVDLCMAAKNRPMFMLNAMSESVRKANIDSIAKNSIDRSISTLVDITGANERIFKSPVPLVYSRHTSRFLTLFLLFLPFGLWKADESWNHIATVPETDLIAFFLLGIEEIGIQLEEPFSVLPLEALCDGAIAACLSELLEQHRVSAFESVGNEQHRVGAFESAGNY